MGKILHDIGLSNDFLHMIPKAQAMKETCSQWLLYNIRIILEVLMFRVETKNKGTGEAS